MGLVFENAILKRDLSIKVAPKGGFYYNNEIFFSKAYQSLRPSSIRLLHCFLMQGRYDQKKKEKKHFWNNGEISFTESQYKEIFGSSSSYLGARDQLVEVGFIMVTYRGGKYRGDCSKYKILCFPDVPLKEQRWREYPIFNWQSEIPKIKNYQPGKNTQWPKGKSGRNFKNTL